MLTVMEMLGCMPILRRVAATDVSALQTHAQMNPLVAYLDAFLTFMLVCPAYSDLVEMRTLIRHLLTS